MLASNQDETDDDTNNDSINNEEITEEYNKFVHFYHSKSLIDYSKIGIPNEQLPDNSHNIIVTIFWENKL